MGLLDSLLSDLASLANPFGSASKGEWNLARGVYTSSTGQSLVFFAEKKGAGDETPTNITALDQISDSGGRRLAIYEYPYVDGQRVEDLGRKGETFTFNIKFFGDDYQDRFQSFVKIVIQDKGTGTLIHPVRSSMNGAPPGGAAKVRLSTYEFLHRYDEWNAVTIKATFIEDNTGSISVKGAPVKVNSALGSLLQTLSNVQAAVSSLIGAVTAILLLPAAIKAGLLARLASIVALVSSLLGQLAATFSSNKQLQSLAAQAHQASSTIPGLTTGTVTQTVGGSTITAKLPPVFQVGFDPVTQVLLTSQINNFVNGNQITPAQAVFSANQIRAQITLAINEVIEALGNDSYDVVVQYRTLAVSIQQAVESCIAAAQPQVIVYLTPSPMSLRTIAYKNNLTPDRQNDIEALNPYLPSVNYIPKGTQVLVPIA